jgi:CRP-like cAMP-binding protein
LPQQKSIRNSLLRAILPEDFARLEPLLQAVSFGPRDMIEAAGAPIENVLFMEAGVSSVVAKSPDGHQIEVGLMGRDGMTGVALLLGDDRSPNETFIQIAGDGFQIGAGELRQQLTQSSTLHATLLRYVHAFYIQTSHTALANGHFKLEERLARWLLMVHDRIDGDRMELTHEFLSIMLGVRRPGVTVALHILEGKGVIRSKRTLIQIVDRSGLEDLANGCYGVPEAEYRRIMG